MTVTVLLGALGWVSAGLALLGALLISRALGARMETVARASHELRGPITAARLGLELTRRDAGLSAGTLRAIDLELSRAAVALDDLACAGTRQAAMSRGLVDVEALVHDCVEASRPDATLKNADLTVRWLQPAGPVWGDRLRLAQATRNLIANAIEHGGRKITVCGSVVERRASLRLEVADDGLGLPAPLKELVRRPRRGRGSRGRGLAIASTIARDHGGRLTAAAGSPGTRLVLELPLAPRALAITTTS
jgi:signal transduction histidine kinase